MKNMSAGKHVSLQFKYPIHANLIAMPYANNVNCIFASSWQYYIHVHVCCCWVDSNIYFHNPKTFEMSLIQWKDESHET